MGNTGAAARAMMAAFIALFVLTLGLTGGAHAEAMSFGLVTLGDAHCDARCPKVVAARGEIADNTADALIGFLGENLDSGVVRSILLLDSPGGKVMAAMELGQTLRRLGMAVIVARPTDDTGRTGALAGGRCYSACVYALMGGRKRVIPPQSRIGVHRMFAYSTSFSISQLSFVRERDVDDGEMLSTLSRYSEKMGVSSNLIRLAERTSPDHLRILTGPEIARWRLGSRQP
jgi:hypothetical protein